MVQKEFGKIAGKKQMTGLVIFDEQNNQNFFVTELRIILITLSNKVVICYNKENLKVLLTNAWFLHTITCPAQPSTTQRERYFIIM